jgi:outer membrane protein OmpA-like peptidoglycan-associated protein/ABC-type nitrate/sulfonate/bicarbonate transport system substrate-binding protein
MTMTSDEKAARTGKFALAIIGLALACGLAYKFVLVPLLEDKELQETGSASQYQRTVRLAADSFSGYAVLRSNEMKNLLKKQGTQLVITDDAADYAKRLEGLKNGDLDMAVFTIDTYLTEGVKAEDFPGSIAMLIDQSKGADAIVAYKDAVPNIQALDHASAKIVVTKGSPSEFLGRVLVTQFSLPAMPEAWAQGENGPKDVYAELLRSKGKKKAFALWEPYVSKALEDPNVHVLFSSAQLSGFIVDVLVVRREFLKEQQAVVKQVVEAYQRAQYSYANQTYGMRRLIVADAKLTNSDALSDDQAQKLAAGIQWSNTMDNYAAFRLIPTPGTDGLEDMITRIEGVLVKTGALRKESAAHGKANTLFYDGVLKELHEANFHPGKLQNVIDGVGPTEKDLEAARSIPDLPELTDDQWKTLRPMGSARVEQVEFRRGSAEITEAGMSDLTELATRLAGMPTTYIRIVGHARADGDPEANLALANARAQAVQEQLTAAGVPRSRLRAEAAKPAGDGGSQQSVSFDLGIAPF